jgi:hypothetical protein
MHTYQDGNGQLPHNGTWNYCQWVWGPPWNNAIMRPQIAEGCSWAYKILPFVEQSALYSNWNYTTPVKTFLDPSRASSNTLSWVPFDPNNGDSYYDAGAISDYAANGMVIGSGLNTVDANGPNWPQGWASGPRGWAMYKRTIQGIADGSSNTILVGLKALAIQAYEKRGPWQFTMSNGSTRDTNDWPIASPGPPGDPGWGMTRANGPDDCWWMAESGTPSPGTGSTLYDHYIPGHVFRPHDWIQWSYIFERDAIDLDSSNKFGGPYSAGTLLGLADGSVRTMRYTTDRFIVIPLLTPNGGDISNFDQ